VLHVWTRSILRITDCKLFASLRDGRADVVKLPSLGVALRSEELRNARICCRNITSEQGSSRREFARGRVGEGENCDIAIDEGERTHAHFPAGSRMIVTAKT